MKIDVYHDTVCPWCRIGKAYLKQALEQWSGEDVEVEYHTFFLNPSIPPEGYDFKEYMTEKGGGKMDMEDWFARPREMGKEVGLTFNFKQIEKAPNSTLSHQLILLAPEDKREAIIDATYDAYFEHGKDIGDIDVLLEIADEHGLDVDTTRDQLEMNAKHFDVMEDVKRAHQIGVRGVPFFVVNERLAFSGAHPPETIIEVMEEAQKQTERS